MAEILKEKGVEKVSVMDLSRDDMAEAIEDAFRYDIQSQKSLQN